MTQLQRVIKAARSFRGTCQADWLAEVTPDGGPRILRVGARIQEAEDRFGASFEIVGTRSKTRVYRLVDAGSGVTPDGTPAREKDTVEPSSRDRVNAASSTDDWRTMIGRGTLGYGEEEHAA